MIHTIDHRLKQFSKSWMPLRDQDLRRHRTNHFIRCRMAGKKKLPKFYKSYALRKRFVLANSLSFHLLYLVYLRYQETRIRDVTISFSTALLCFDEGEQEIRAFNHICLLIFSNSKYLSTFTLYSVNVQAFKCFEEVSYTYT